MREDELAPLYCSIMEELKARVSTMSEVAWNIRQPVNEVEDRLCHFMLEGLYLQLRKVCELFSRGVLVIQSADPQFTFRKYQREYRADKIFRVIDEINPRCFPRPIDSWRGVPGSVEQINEYPAIFSSSDLKDAYFQCDVVLHAWKLEVLRKPRVTELNQDFIKGWVKKLLDGLNHHIVSLPTPDRHLVVQMHTPEQGHVTSMFVSTSA